MKFQVIELFENACVCKMCVCVCVCTLKDAILLMPCCLFLPETSHADRLDVLKKIDQA